MFSLHRSWAKPFSNLVHTAALAIRGVEGGVSGVPAGAGGVGVDGHFPGGFAVFGVFAG